MKIFVCLLLYWILFLCIGCRHFNSHHWSSSKNITISPPLSSYPNHPPTIQPTDLTNHPSVHNYYIPTNTILPLQLSSLSPWPLTSALTSSGSTCTDVYYIVSNGSPHLARGGSGGCLPTTATTVGAVGQNVLTLADCWAPTRMHNNMV